MDCSEEVCEHTKRKRAEALALAQQQSYIAEVHSAHEFGHAYEIAIYDRNLLQANADHARAEISQVERTLGFNEKEAAVSHPELAQTLRMMRENLANIEHQIEVISARISILAEFLD